MKEKEEKRGGGRRLFSEEERKEIVAQIERGQVTRQQAMQQYGIVDPNTIRIWILRYAVNPESILGRVFTKADKRQAAYRIITGEASNTQLATQLNVDLSTLRMWVRQVRAQMGLSKNKNIPSSSEISAHHQALEDLRLKVAALETMIDIAEKEFHIDIRKKSGTKR